MESVKILIFIIDVYKDKLRDIYHETKKRSVYLKSEKIMMIRISRKRYKFFGPSLNTGPARLTIS